MIALQLLRTRVARRILVLFLTCAVVPVATFAILAYRATADRLQSDARQTLRDGSKTAAMIVMERLHALVSELGATTSRPSFEAIVLERADGHLDGYRGRFPALPALSEIQKAHLASGGPVILVDTARGIPWVFTILPREGSRTGYPRWWGMASPKVLVGNDPGLSPAPEGTEFCLLDTRGNALECPSPEVVRTLNQSERDNVQLNWRRADSTFLLARRDLFLAGEFASPSWTIALSLPESSVLVPLASFRRTFLQGVLLAAVLVFVLSHVQLRKRMTPLAELEAGVQRLSAGDFSTPVIVKSDDEFETLAGSFNGMASDLRDQFMTLTALRSVDIAALEAGSAIAIAEAALRSAPGLMDGNRGVVAFAGGSEPGVWTVLSMAPNGAERRETRVSPGHGELRQLEATLEALHFAPGEPGPSYFGGVHLPADAARVVFPLRQNGRIQAALVIAAKRDSAFPPPLIARGRQLADQLAVGLANVSLLGELDALSHGAMLALARTIDAVSPWTAGHSERVTQGALEIGRRLGLDRAALDRLERGSLLHDIGKIGVPAAILDKAGRLTPEERSIIESHPVIGAEIISPIAAFRELRGLVLYHHELLDGSGYPDGLSGEAIPQIVRVLTVADIFDALVSDRPYRAGLTPERALSILRDGSGRKYDERAVLALEDAVREGWSTVASADSALRRARPAATAAPTAGLNVREEVFT